MNLPELLSDLTIHYNALIRQAASHLGLTQSQAFHLISVPYEGVSMSRLSRKLGLDTSTLTRNIQKLEKMGLVERSADPYDKRIQNTALTQGGGALVKKIESLLLETSQLILDHIDLEDQEHITTVLEKLVWSMDCAREE